jgi:uncharacterized membrane protein
MPVDSRSRWLSVLTATAFIVALTSFLDRVFWWTHKQFADCAIQIGSVPQPPYCRAYDELDWIIWYGPPVSLVISAVVLLLRRRRWHSSPYTPVVLFWLSVLMSIRTVFVMLVRFAMSGIH